VATFVGTLAAFAATMLPQAAGAAPLRLPPIHETRLPNGAQIFLMEKHDVPLVAFQALLRGGSMTDPPGKEGTASIAADLLRKGAGKRDASAIARYVDGVGGILGSGAAYEAASISGEFPSGEAERMVALLADMLRRPAFPDSEFVKLREQTVEQIRSAKDNPYNVLQLYGRAYFLRGHPYGRPVDGDESSVARITREDVLAHYRAHYGADRLILAVVGDFDRATMERRIRAAFGDWGKAGAPPADPASPARLSGRHVLLVDKPGATQSYFWIGNLGISARDPDRDAVDIANTAFGGRFTSLLVTALRTKSGLSYTARSTLMRLSQPGPVAMTSFTKTETTERAIDLALSTLADFRDQGLDQETVASSKAYLSGLQPTDLESGDEIAARLASLAYHGLPTTEATEYGDRIRAVSLDAVAKVIHRVYPPGDDLTFVVIGDAGKLRKVAKKYGPVSEIKMEQPILEALGSKSR
jgi:predicted Zn-dependent peptidase